MTSGFITDCVSSLSESLAEIAELHAEKLALHASAKGKSRPADHDLQFILHQIHSINGHSPEMMQSAVAHVLANYRTSTISTTTNKTNTRHPSNDFLHWVFSAKATIGAYQHMLQILLAQTMRVSNETFWWREVNPYYYSISILPNRLTTTIREISTDVYETASIRPLAFNLFQLSRLQILHNARSEIRENYMALDRTKADLATAIGYLYRHAYFDNAASSTIESLKGRVSDMVHVLGQVASSEFALTEPCFENNVLSLEQTLDNLSVVLLSVQSRKYQSASLTVSQQSLQKHKRPNTITRSWLPIAISTIGTLWLVQRYHRVTLKDMTAAVIGTYRFIVNGFTDWVVKPMRDIYETVRHRERRLAIMGAQSLQNDLLSLERMVVDYASSQGKIVEADLPSVIEHVRAGDLSLVLDDYEREIHRPITSALTGTLITLMLIQVQKTKVDVELAMAALDKLLRSNELNFAFLAVLPTIGVTIGSFRYLIKTFQRRKGIAQDIAQSRLKRSLWNVERTLAATADVQTETDNKQLGTLLVELTVLRSLTKHVRMSREERERLMSDIREIERASVGAQRKLNVVDRMYRNYRFLRPY